MNGYIPVLDQQPPPGFISNVTWRCLGPSEIHGHTPPRRMPIVCPCVYCAAERMVQAEALMVEVLDGYGPERSLDDIVLGPVWFGHEDPGVDPRDYVGLYLRASMENK